MSHPAIAVLEYELTGYRRTWRGSALSSFVLPVLFMLGFGLGVGSFVDDAGTLGGISYLDYIVPGMIATTAMQVAFGESAWPVMAKFVWIRTYHGMAATPLRVADIIAGDLLFAVFRVFTTTAVFVVVTALFGSVHSPWAVLVPLICALLGAAVAAPMMAFGGRVETDGYFPLVMRLVVLPMSLFAGVFFPVETMPAGLRVLAYLSPLWHGVELCRAATTGVGSAAAVVGHIGYLALWVAGGFWLARLAFRRRLVA